MEKNLKQEEAVKKFRDLVKEINVCMFITNHPTDESHTRPMATIDVEENGTLWFFTDIRSIKVEEVSQEKQVHLTYAHPGRSSYMDVTGITRIVTEREQIREKWKPLVKAWFPEGPEDKNLALMSVVPTEVYYWEAESGRMVEFFKMAASVVTGKRLAEGTEGSLKI